MVFGVVLPRLQDLASTTQIDASSLYNQVNCVSAATEFFNNVRTPAALLIIPALNSLWVDLSSSTRRTRHPVAQSLYTMAVMLTLLFDPCVRFRRHCRGHAAALRRIRSHELRRYHAARARV